MVIDLSNKTLDESFLRMLGTSIQSILQAMFGGNEVPLSVKGSPQDVKAFASVLNQEKRYLEAYQKLGLNNPITYQSKFKLNKAIRDFERTTGLPWPLK